MKQTYCLVLLALCLGCGSGNGSSSPSGTMAGNWNFSAKSSMFGITVSGTGQLQQTVSGGVSGTINLSGTPCATTASLSGTLNGQNLSFGLEEGEQTVNFTGTVNSSFNAASGNYGAPAGGCTNGDTGTWTATKQ